MLNAARKESPWRNSLLGMRKRTESMMQPTLLFGVACARSRAGEAVGRRRRRRKTPLVDFVPCENSPLIADWATGHQPCGVAQADVAVMVSERYKYNNNGSSPFSGSAVHIAAVLYRKSCRLC